ncbi:MAG: YicC family protein [Deltaproteobacteria bacterium]|nr:YicC family protein [Deltaproteobacteria bacterium]
MIRSMTGYGRAEAVLGGRKYVVEIKSLNHRYLELSLRIPANLLPLELEIKKKINEQLIRGRIDVTIRRETYGGIEGTRLLEVNLPLVKNYYDLLIQLKDLFNLKEDITLDMMARLKDVFIPLETLEDEITVLWEGLAGVLSNAIAALIDMRQKEGEVLGQDLKARLYLINEHLDEIDARAPRIVLEYQKRLVERIRELMDGMVIDESRLSQEVAIMAEKSDITEEIVRFRSHIKQFLEMLKSPEAMGRKVDFLIQEMNREVNTIGSKSSDAEVSCHVIEIKSELAKLREQVQNLE